MVDDNWNNEKRRAHLYRSSGDDWVQIESFPIGFVKGSAVFDFDCSIRIPLELLGRGILFPFNSIGIRPCMIMRCGK